MRTQSGDPLSFLSCRKTAEIIRSVQWIEANCGTSSRNPQILVGVLRGECGVMAMFLRFVVGTQRENGYWLTGVIVSARTIRDKSQLYGYESAYLDEIFAWFNANLPCPPFRQKIESGEWTPDAVCWFHPGAKVPIRRIWDIVAILREHRVPVRMLTTPNPGEIVYTDDFQVVAETPRWA
jgi:hypothetical protein